MLVKDHEELATVMATLRNAGCFKFGLILEVAKHAGNGNLPHDLSKRRPGCSEHSTDALHDKVREHWAVVLTLRDFLRQSSVSHTVLRCHRLPPRRLSL